MDKKIEIIGIAVAVVGAAIYLSKKYAKEEAEENETNKAPQPQKPLNSGKNEGPTVPDPRYSKLSVAAGAAAASMGAGLSFLEARKRAEEAQKSVEDVILSNEPEEVEMKEMGGSKTEEQKQISGKVQNV